MWVFCPSHAAGHCHHLFSFDLIIPMLQCSEFSICPVVLHGNANSIQNPSSVTNPTIKFYCCLLPFTLPCCTTRQKSLIFNVQNKKKHQMEGLLTRMSIGYILYQKTFSIRRRQRTNDI